MHHAGTGRKKRETLRRGNEVGRAHMGRDRGQTKRAGWKTMLITTWKELVLKEGKRLAPTVSRKGVRGRHLLEGKPRCSFLQDSDRPVENGDD